MNRDILHDLKNVKKRIGDNISKVKYKSNFRAAFVTAMLKIGDSYLKMAALVTLKKHGLYNLIVWHDYKLANIENHLSLTISSFFVELTFYGQVRWSYFESLQQIV